MFARVGSQRNTPRPPAVASSTITTGDGPVFTIDMPSEKPDDDLYVAIVFVSDRDNEFTNIDAGWTSIETTAETNNARLHSWWWVGSSEPSSYTVSSSSSIGDHSAIVYRITGVDTISPIDASSSFSGEAGGTTVPILSIESVTNNVLALVSLGVKNRDITATPLTSDGVSINSKGSFASCHDQQDAQGFSQSGSFTIDSATVTAYSTSTILIKSGN